MELNLIFLLCVTLITISLPVPVMCGKILIFVSPVWSHIKPMLNIAASLKDRYGHHSTFILDGKNADRVRKFNTTNVIETRVSIHPNDLIKDACSKIILEQIPPAQIIINDLCQSLLLDEELFTVLRQMNFDLALVDNVVFADCFLVLAYKLGIPYIQVGIVYMPIRTRIPFSPSVHSAITYLGFVDYHMTFVERVANTLISVVMAVSPHMFFQSDMVATYAPEKPFVPLGVLHRRTAFHLYDLDFVLDFPKPFLPNMAFVGGLSTELPKPLSTELNSYMNSAVNGVIIASLESIAERLPFSRIETLIGVFKKFENMNFVLRYGNVTQVDENVLLMPWLPQNDLLAHPKTKVFITHCGNSGQYEALYNAVPMIGLPFLSDGFTNCRKMAFKGFGISYGFCSFTEDELSNAINAILLDSHYRDNIRKASRIFNGQQGTPSERAAYWVSRDAIWRILPRISNR